MVTWRAYSQNPRDTPVLWGNERDELMIVQFHHSVHPFCTGEYSAVSWWIMPCSLSMCQMSWLMYSPPLSLCKILGLCPSWVSLQDMNVFSAMAKLLFTQSGIANAWLEKSSKKDVK